MKITTVILFIAFSFCLSFCQTKSKNNFDNGSGISKISLNPEKVQDLVILGKVWGYLKYYHPAVASGKYNWDGELFKILPEVINCKNREDRNKLLTSWIDSLGEPKNLKSEKIDTSLARIISTYSGSDANTQWGKSAKGMTVKMYPDLNWISDTALLGKELVLKLNRIKNAEGRTKNYYVSLVDGVGNAQFDNEEPYKEFKYPTAGFRLLALYRYWNIIQYYFPYKYLIEKNWNTILPEFIPKFVNANDELEYKLSVLSLMAHVHDSHAVVLNPDNTIQEFHGKNYPPMPMTFIDGKAVIRKILNKEVKEKSGLKVGDVILSCDNKSVDDLLKERLPYTPGSNYPSQLRNITRSDLLSTNYNSVSITYERNGVISTTSVECFAPESMPLDEEYKKQDTCFKTVGEGIIRIYPGSIKTEYLEKAMPEILKSKGIVIDMRCYPSDFIVFSLGKYLVPKPTEFVEFTMGSIDTPGLFYFVTTLSVGEKNPEYYKGKIVIIVNEQTQSSAEYHCMAFRVAPKATVIGNTTAGADGNVSYFYLPGGISTRITGIGVYYPDGRETQRVGIVPDIEVKPTIKGIRDGRDELLEKAIEIINKE